MPTPWDVVRLAVFTACCSKVMFEPSRCSKNSSAYSPPRDIATVSRSEAVAVSMA